MAARIISVDVQPCYMKDIDWLSQYRQHIEDKRVLFVYNSEELSGDTEDCIDDYLEQHMIESTNHVRLEKEYGFLRSWMDLGVDEETIIEAIRYMRAEGIYDSRDIDEAVWNKRFSDCPEDDPIFIPDELDEYDWTPWSGCELVGGGIDECLAELSIWLKAIYVHHTINHRYTY